MTSRYRATLLALLGFAACAKPSEVSPIPDLSGGTGGLTTGGTSGGGAGGASAGSGGTTSGSAGTMGGTMSSGGAGAGAGGGAGTAGGGTSGSAGTAGKGGGGAGGASGAGSNAGTGGASGTSGTSSGQGGTGGSAGTAGSGGSDACPSDPMKIEPGACGCGTPDTDSDDDETPDCDDECPMDPLRTAPTDCPCGGSAACLLHRYSFAGSGTAIADEIGNADGTAVGASVSGGSITLAGGTSDEYVELPASALADLTSATFEAWVTWTSGTSTWERIFDFGDSDGGAGEQGGEGVTYLFLTPRAGTGGNYLRAAFTIAGPGEEVFIDASAALATNTMLPVAVVFDGEEGNLILYLDGVEQGSSSVTDSLSGLNAVNNWIGRSQFQSDPEFTGSIHEFRIYGSARSAAQLSASAEAGPDAVPSN